MKKTIKKKKKGILGVIASIILFLDKWLITPITKLILKVTDFFKNNSQGFERFISKKQTLIVASLVFAFAVFILVDRESTMMIDQQAEILYNQEVTPIYNEEAYVVEGLPKTVDITLIGKRRHIFLAKQSPVKTVSVDLTGLQPGSHKVTLKYSQSVSSINYKLDPSTAQIYIYEKVSETRELTTDVLHRDSLDSKLYIKNIELSRNNVIIKGAEHRLKEVATVKALVDVNNISNPQVGEMTLKDVPLVAYDTEGQIVDVEVVPNKIDAKILITSPSKEVPVQVVPTGEIAFGKAIKSLITNVSTVVVYGDEAELEDLNMIPVEIDITDLDRDKEFNVNIKKPNGVRDISTKTVVVKVAIDDLSTKEFENIGISTENLGSEYRVQALSVEDSAVTVIVKGSQSVLDELDTATIHPYVDLSNYAEGEYEVDVLVRGDDLRLNYSLKQRKVKIRIMKK